MPDGGFDFLLSYSSDYITGMFDTETMTVWFLNLQLVIIANFFNFSQLGLKGLCCSCFFLLWAKTKSLAKLYILGEFGETPLPFLLFIFFAKLN